MDSIIQAKARKYNLPVNLVRAIIEQESNGIPVAFRFEPAFLERYVKPDARRFGPHISKVSERIGRAISWGPMQVMGETARMMGFDKEFLTELCDPEYGIEYGCKYLDWQRGRWLSKFGWKGVIASYNAGSPVIVSGGVFRNQEYVDQVLNRIEGDLSFLTDEPTSGHKPAPAP